MKQSFSGQPNDLGAGEEAWAGLRLTQFKALKSIPNTGMAVTIDTSDDGAIHPNSLSTHMLDSKKKRAMTPMIGRIGAIRYAIFLVCLTFACSAFAAEPAKYLGSRCCGDF